MSAISRRSFLKQAPIAAVVAGTPITMAVAEIRAEPSEDSDMRCMRLARELFNAMKAHYGDGCKMIRNEDNGAVFFLPPPPPVRIVEFSGPGWYEVEAKGKELPTEEMWIEVDAKFPPHPTRGRFFKARSGEKRRYHCHFEEAWLRQIIIRKIGGAA
jgi:hypothetical protein